MFWFNRWVACTVVCLIACLVIVGCGPSDSAPDDNPGDGNNTQANLTPSSADPATGGPATGDPTSSNGEELNNPTAADGTGTSSSDPKSSDDNEADPVEPSITDVASTNPNQHAGGDNSADANPDSVNPTDTNESDDPSDPQATDDDDDDDEVVIPRDPITGRPLPPRELTEGSTPKQPEKKVKTLGLEKIPAAKPTGKRTHFVTFDDLVIGMKQDEKFKPQMLTKKVVDLNNQRVKIQGFIFPALPIARGIKAFPLVKNTECKFGPGGTAHHLVDIKMAKGVTIDYTTRIVTVEGILTIKPFDGFDGNTWSIYEMKCEKAY